MGWKRRAGGGKRDLAEGPIVAALEAVGAQVWRLGGTGNPDLLIRWKGRYEVGEVKTGKGRRTKNQADVPWPIWRTIDDVLIDIGVITGPPESLRQKVG